MNKLEPYEITWRDRDLGPIHHADGTVSDVQRNNVEAEDAAQARDVFNAFYGHYNYEILNVELYQGTNFAKWVASRVGR